MVVLVCFFNPHPAGVFSQMRPAGEDSPPPPAQLKVEPGMNPAPLIRAPQKARPGLNFGPGRAAGPELCISSLHTEVQVSKYA